VSKQIFREILPELKQLVSKLKMRSNDVVLPIVKSHKTSVYYYILFIFTISTSYATGGRINFGRSSFNWKSNRFFRVKSYHGLPLGKVGMFDSGCVRKGEAFQSGTSGNVKGYVKLNQKILCASSLSKRLICNISRMA